MKKIILTLMILIITTNISLAANPVLDKIETALYGFTYNSEMDELRLNRLEEEIYGQASNGTTKQRLEKIKTDIAAANIGKEIAPKEDTFMEEEDRYVDEKSYQLAKQKEQGVPAGPGVDYPAINELEQIVFNKEFKTMELNDRLSKLEEKAFKKTYANDDFNSRVDRLRADLKPKSLMDNAIAQSSNMYYDDEPITLSRDYNLQRYDSPNAFDYQAYNNAINSNPYGFAQGGYYTDMGRSRTTGGAAPFARSSKKVNLTAVENSVFKRTYAEDNTDSRLARLENNMFGTTFDNDSETERINRIGSAFNAQKSASKYDSNKFSQNITTGVQIGMFILMMLACIL